MGDLTYLQISSTRASIRVNLPKGMESSYLSRAKVKITNLSLTVVIIFIITNLPYMVDEFIRQEILASSWCTMSWCGAVEVTPLRLAHITVTCQPKKGSNCNN